MRTVLLFGLTVLACGQSVQVTLLPQATIEKRLRAFTTKNATREPAVKSLFQEAGCKDEALSEESVKGAKAPNLICTLKGETDSVIIVGAHFDLVEEGQGVVDNWSGVSLLSSIYQALASTGRKHTYRLIAFTGEERGLLGSQAYVKQLGNQKSQVKAMVNLDTLGLGQTQVWLSHADHNLAIWLGGVAKQMNIPLGAVDVDKVGTTDSEPFREKKIPAITIHSVTQSTLSILHSRRDQIGAIHLDDYYQTYRLVASYGAALDQLVN